MATFKQGLQTITWNGQTVHVYAQKDDQEIGLLSTPKYTSASFFFDSGHCSDLPQPSHQQPCFFPLIQSPSVRL